MTPEQEKEARDQYIARKLSPDDLKVKEEIERANLLIKEYCESVKTAQKRCSHPLIARTVKNAGSSGYGDGDSNYWTDHTCAVCGLRWYTSQSWERRGTKLGLPSESKL